VNKKAFESLALSGGFDSFGLPREAFFASDGKATFLESLMRYGQLYQAGQKQAQNSLFGYDDEVLIATPSVPNTEPWSNLEKLNRERDLIGIYLSAHPLDDYKIVLNSLCNTHCRELADKMSLFDNKEKKEVTFGGIVTAVKKAMTKSGTPCGFVTIEDFDGSGELALYGEEWGKCNGMFAEGCTVFVRGKYFKKFPTSNFIDFSVSDVQYLQTVREKQIEKFTISFDRNSIDETVVDDLITMVEEESGKTDLCFQLIDSEHGTSIDLRSSKKINVSNKLVSYIEANENMDYRVN
jgi:DNA polymerase-3 subunit alpha